jgi:hypothetical protein
MDGIQLQIDLTNIVLAGVAIVALWAAWRQLHLTQLATRASVLLSLDERFGTQAMLDARNEMMSLLTRVYKITEEQWGGLSTDARNEKGRDLYPVELEKMRKESSESYSRLMVALSFFETVGYVTYSGYIPLNDVIKLFGPAVKEAGMVFEAHVKKLQDVYQNKDLYNNFLWLITVSKQAPQNKKRRGARGRKVS